MKSNTSPFWEMKTLSEMSHDEWESLCDHCGKCCLVKLQDENESDEQDSVYYTNIICNLYDIIDGQCRDYLNRLKRVPNCVHFAQENLAELEYMPPSCSYRRVMEGRGLAKWHHLVTGDKQTIHANNKSVLGRVVIENKVNEEDLEEHIVTWPLK